MTLPLKQQATQLKKKIDRRVAKLEKDRTALYKELHALEAAMQPPDISEAAQKALFSLNGKTKAGAVNDKATFMERPSFAEESSGEDEPDAPKEAQTVVMEIPDDFADNADEEEPAVDKEMDEAPEDVDDWLADLDEEEETDEQIPADWLDDSAEDDDEPAQEPTQDAEQTELDDSEFDDPFGDDEDDDDWLAEFGDS
ncbi:MAG: hypothetical protein GY803_24790 [Chloroflexi bacterium]|nr:hypothetical protein [Chloroflexota bacterium]